jgi:hypothetical protein
VIRWSQVAPVLIEVFSGIALEVPVEPAFPAQWAEGSKKFVHPQIAAELTLKVTSVIGEPGDERRYEEITVTPTSGAPYTMLQESVVGMRRFVLQVRVESFAHTPDADRWCWSMVERIRTSLKFTRIQQRFQEVNVAVLDADGTTADATYTFDKRRVNAAVLDVTFYAAFCLSDSVPMNWIEHVELQRRIKGVGDALLPTPPNGDEYVPPLPTP